jgi:outer membrane protein
MKLITRILGAALILALSLGASAQNKFGHVDFGKLYSMMPGQDTIKAQYEAYKLTLQGQLNKMQVEYENKVAEYNKVKATMPAPILKSMEEEIIDMEARIMKFQQDAQAALEDKEAELTEPVIEAARKAVEDVAKENGYTYVFNSAGGMLLYAKESDDILPLVKKKLGITQ